VSTEDGRPMQDGAELRRARRSDRLAFWGQVAVGVVVVLGAVFVGVRGLGLSTGVVGGLVAAIGVGAVSFMGGRRGHTMRSDSESITQGNGTDSGGRRFSNFAFSQTLPTWHGWQRDVGDVVVDSDGVTINGLKRRLDLRAPLHAKLHDAKYSYWTMVEVTGLSEQGQQVVVYLVAEGAPRSKFSAKPEYVHRRGEELVNEIGNAFP
jgi:hypothetical protein